MKPFDLEAAKNGAKVVTLDGRDVRIVCFDVKQGHYPVGAYVTDGEGLEHYRGYTNEGRHRFGVHDDDLCMAPVKRECWINFYVLGGGVNNTIVHSTKAEADANAGADRISCIHHEWEE